MKSVISVRFWLFVLLLVLTACAENTEEKMATRGSSMMAAVDTARVTFIELGSVNCVPCKAMQPVMLSIEQKYGSQIKVVFHDVWKDRSIGRKYGISVIPTQIFLNEHGDEIMRHEGFFPEEEIDKLLQSRGLEIINGT